MAAGGTPDTPPPGQLASGNYTNPGQSGMNAGYVWLPVVGWVWQDANGHIANEDQTMFATGTAARETADARAGNPSILRWDATTGTYTRVSAGFQDKPGPGATLNNPGVMPAGWLTENQIQALAKAAGISGFQGYTSSYTYDSQGNPITLVGVTDQNGKTYTLDGNGNATAEDTNADRQTGMQMQAAADAEAKDKADHPWNFTDDPNKRNAWDRLTSMLSEYGLGDLNKFAWDAVTNGDSQERILQNLRDTPTYKNRFKGMAVRKDKGLRAISESEYLDYERSVRQLMAEAGLPGDMWDNPDDYANFIGNDVSIRELTQRTNDLFDAANSAPAEVQQAFKDYFGVDGTHALATYFMDPTKALPILQQQLAEAQVGGSAKRFGVGVGIDRANQIARLGMQPSQYDQKFAQVASMSPLFRESVTEGQDLTQDTGIDASFFGNQDATNAIQQRGDTRSAAFQGGGGAALSGSGALGLQQDQ